MATNYAKNLASGTLAESVSASTTTLLVYVGEGGDTTIKSVWPDTPFYATIMPENPSAGVANSLDSEIVKVNAVGTDGNGNTTLTVTRGQRETTTKAFTAGAIVTNANYTEDAAYANIDPPDFFTNTEETVSGSGTEFTISPTLGFPLTSAELKGDTKQQTYSGGQLLTGDGMATPSSDSTYWASFSSTNITLTPQNKGWGTITQTATGFGNFQTYQNTIKGLAVSTTYTLIVELKNVSGSGSLDIVQTTTTNDAFGSFEIIQGASISSATNARISLSSQDAITVLKVTTRDSFTSNTRGLRFFTRDSVTVGSKFDIRATVLAGDHSSDWQNYCGDNYEPYVGGIPAPSPDYPQSINTVTGRQVVTISDGSGQSQEYEVNLGKNLFNNQAEPTLNSYTTISTITNGVRATMDRNTGAGTYDFSTFIIDDANKYIGKTLSVSVGTMTPSSTNTPQVRLITCDSTGGNRSNVATLNSSNSSISAEITSAMAGKKIAISFYSTAGGSASAGAYVDYENVQLELGSTATSYAPYFEPIELCKIGNYQDRIYKSGSDWYLHKETATSTLDGTESWSYSSGSQKYFYTNSISATSLGAVPSAGGLCTHYIYDSSRLSAHGFNYGNAWFFQIMNADYTDTTNFKSWLSQSKPVFYYALATPTDTQITNTALIDQLNAMAATTYNGSTIFNVDGNGNLAAVLDATTARKNLAGLISVIKSCCE